MRKVSLSLLVSLLLSYLTPVFGSASLTADLETLLSEANRTALIPVIIKFQQQVDITTLRGEVSQQLQYAPAGFEVRKRHQQLLRNKLVTGLKEKVSEPRQALVSLLRRYGVKAEIKSLWSINALALKLPAHLVDEVAALPGIERISVDMQLSMNASTPELVTAEPLWNLNDVRTDYLWQQGYAGEGVVVAIMDSGADINHPDLFNSWRGGTNSWFDPYHQHELPSDHNGHGTQALSLIVGGDASGYQIGMAPHAQWIAAKLFDDADQSSLSAIHEAFQWMLDPDGDPNTNDAPDVVNNSWGFANTINQCYQEFSDDIRLLREAGIAVVFSAGNYGPNDETSISPANDPGALSVGSIDQFRDIDLFSSRGPGACDGGVFPKLVAPGSLVYAADRLPIGYNVVSGTSFAAPHVTGAIALLKGAFPMATVSQIETALYDSAIDLGNRGSDDQFGYGMIDVAAAYDLLFRDLGSHSAGMFMFSEALYSVDESTQKLIVNVRRLGGSQGEVSLDYATSDDQASSARPADFIATSGSLRFADGETLRSFEISILDDSLDEANETFYINLSNPSGDALLGSRSQVPVTILDDDGPGSLSFSAVSYAVNETHAQASVSVIRTGGNEGTVSVDLSLISNTAQLDADFLQPTQTTLLFAAGEMSKEIHIPLVNDDLHEVNESFNLMLASPTGGANLGTPAATTVTILDDDPDTSVTSIRMEAVNYLVSENGGKVTLSVQRSGNIDREATVEYTTVEGSAKAGKDYRAKKGKLTFWPKVSSRSVTLSILDDGVFERESSFNLVLTRVDSGSQLANPAAAIIRIRDDDAKPYVSLGSSGNGSGVRKNIGSFDALGSDLSGFGNNNEATDDNPTEASTGGSSLKIFDLSLRGYAGVDDDALRQLQTLGGQLEVPQDVTLETAPEDSKKTGCDDMTSADGCKTTDDTTEAKATSKNEPKLPPSEADSELKE